MRGQDDSYARFREPASRQREAPVAQLDRAPDYESGGQEFESLRARHYLASRFRAENYRFYGFCKEPPDTCDLLGLIAHRNSFCPTTKKVTGLPSGFA